MLKWHARDVFGICDAKKKKKNSLVSGHKQLQ